jgi:hypothetical protein
MDKQERNHKIRYLEFLLKQYRELRWAPKERQQVFKVSVGSFTNLALYKLQELNDNSVELMYHVCKSKRFCIMYRREIVLNLDMIQLIHIDGIIIPLKIKFTEQIHDIDGTKSVYDKKPVFKGHIVNATHYGFLPSETTVYAVAGYKGERNEDFSKIYTHI